MTAKATRLEPPRLALDIKDAAAACGLSVSTLDRAHKAGLLKAKRSGTAERGRGAKRVFRVRDLEAWLDSLEDA